MTISVGHTCATITPLSHLTDTPEQLSSHSLIWQCSVSKQWVQFRITHGQNPETDVLIEYYCPNTSRLIHNRLDWLLCHASHESPCANKKKLHCFRAYHFAPPKYTATSEFTHKWLCTSWTVPWQSINVCKLAGKSQSTLRQNAISRCTPHTGVCVCVCVLPHCAVLDRSHEKSWHSLGSIHVQSSLCEFFS